MPFTNDLGTLSGLATTKYMQGTFLLGQVCYRSIVRDLSRMLQKAHALALVVPQKGCVMQKSLLGDGLRIAPELQIPKTIVCKHAVILGIPGYKAWQNMAVYAWNLALDTAESDQETGSQVNMLSCSLHAGHSYTT